MDPKANFQKEIQQKISYYEKELDLLNHNISDKLKEYYSTTSQTRKNDLNKKIKLFLKKKRFVEKQISFYKSDFFKYPNNFSKSAFVIPSFNDQELTENGNKPSRKKSKQHYHKKHTNRNNRAKLIASIIILIAIIALLIFLTL